MNSIFKKSVLLLLSIALLFGLCSCVLFYKYYDFEFKIIDEVRMREDFTLEDLSSEQFEFLKIENVIITPRIWIEDYNESEDYIEPLYSVCIYAFSETGTEKIIIKNVTIKENDSVLLNYEINQNIEFKKYDYDDSIYESRTFTDLFTGEEINVEGGKAYSLVVDVELIKDDEVVSKSITYEIIAHGYIQTVMP